MYIPQYVIYVKKKKGTNITILKRGKNIMKCELQISYTNIVSEDLHSLSNSINPLKPSNFYRCRKQCVEVWRNFVHSYSVTCCGLLCYEM